MLESTAHARAVADPRVSVVSPAPRAAWDAVLASDPGATALQTPEYFAAVLSGTGGRDASRLYILPEGRRLVLPLGFETSCALALPFRPLPLLLLLLRLHRIPAAWLNPCQFA